LVVWLLFACFLRGGGFGVWKVLDDGTGFGVRG